MPAVSRLRVAVSAAAVVPVVPASPDATAAAVDDECCSICLDSLASKRQIRIAPCGHLFHRTCAIQWLETRCCADFHQCPLCRAGVTALSDERGALLLPVRAYGPTGQPTKKRVLSEAFHRNTDDYLKQRHWEIQRTMVLVRSARAFATAAGAPDEYLADVDVELETLEDRERIYGEMRLVLQAGGMRATLDELRVGNDDPWDMASEMETLRGVADQARVQRAPLQRRASAAAAARQSQHPAARVGRTTAAAMQAAARPSGRTTATAARAAAAAPSARDLRATARAARRV